jgi:hypothetical protein
MELTAETFCRTLQGIQSLMPYGKTLNEAALLIAWTTLPHNVRNQLTSEMLAYAAGQYLQDPEPPKDQPVHLALLRYLYRLENGRPNYEWGLKLDLPQRMAGDGRFFPEPVSEAALVAAGELFAHDGPRHAPAGVLAQLQQGRP